MSIIFYNSRIIQKPNIVIVFNTLNSLETYGYTFSYNNNVILNNFNRSTYQRLIIVNFDYY